MFIRLLAEEEHHIISTSPFSMDWAYANVALAPDFVPSRNSYSATACFQEASDAAPARRHSPHPCRIFVVDATDCSHDQAFLDIREGIDYRQRDTKVEELVDADKVVVLVDFGRWELGIDLLSWCIGVVTQ